jgi:hypothetical protein
MNPCSLVEEVAVVHVLAIRCRVEYDELETIHTTCLNSPGGWRCIGQEG